jgi:hypothetical protein
VPDGGVYVSAPLGTSEPTPDTEAFSCVAVNGAGQIMSNGFAQLIPGVAGVMFAVVVAVVFAV